MGFSRSTSQASGAEALVGDSVSSTDNDCCTVTDMGNSSGSDSDSPVAHLVIPKAVTGPSFQAPKVWMLVLGVVFASCAGAVDTITWRGLSVFVSHVTGTVARVGMRLEGVTKGTHERWDVFHSMLIVSSFICGSFFCGLFVPKVQLTFGGRSFYGLALLMETSLLVLAALVAPEESVQGDAAKEAEAIIAGCLAAAACGLQNAMCTIHFGAIVRTTHLSGCSTDIGSTAGRAAMILLRNGCKRRNASTMELADLQDDKTKLRVLLPLLAGFLQGAIMGAFLYTALGMYALLVPAAVTGGAGVIYMTVYCLQKKSLRQLEQRRLRTELLEMVKMIRRASAAVEKANEEGHKRGEDDKELDDMDDLLQSTLAQAQEVEEVISELEMEDSSSDHEFRVPPRCRTL